MTNKAKPERNKELVRRRQNNPNKWTWGRLGLIYNIHRQTAKDLYRLYVDKYGKI